MSLTPLKPTLDPSEFAILIRGEEVDRHLCRETLIGNVEDEVSEVWDNEISIVMGTSRVDRSLEKRCTEVADIWPEFRFQIIPPKQSWCGSEVYMPLPKDLVPHKLALVHAAIGVVRGDNGSDTLPSVYSKLAMRLLLALGPRDDQFHHDGCLYFLLSEYPLYEVLRIGHTIPISDEDRERLGSTLTTGRTKYAAMFCDPLAFVTTKNHLSEYRLMERPSGWKGDDKGIKVSSQRLRTIPINGPSWYTSPMTISTHCYIDMFGRNMQVFFKNAVFIHLVATRMQKDGIL